MSYDKASRKRIKDKKMRCYTWGGVGKAKRAERSGFALIFLVLFVSRQKEHIYINFAEIF